MTLREAEHPAQRVQEAAALSARLRAMAPEQRLAQLRGSVEERTFAFDRAAADQEQRTIWLSISSEQPYRRWWGIEILDHQRKSIRTERLSSAAPLLMDHTVRDQVGVIERWELGADKKLRILARFGRSTRAEEVWRDVLDGIRRNASVGYQIHDLVLERQDEEIETYRVTDWEPFEGSLTAIPADVSIGVGRALQAPHEKGNAMEGTQGTPAPGAGSGTVDNMIAQRAVVAQQVEAEIAKRNGEILALGQQYARLCPTAPDLARQAIATQGMTAEKFRLQILEAIEKDPSNQATRTGQLDGDTLAGRGLAGNNNGNGYGMAAREMLAGVKLQHFRGIGDALSPSLGRKISDQEAAYRAGKWCQAVIHGNASAMRWCQDAGVELRQGFPEQLGFESRTVTSGVFTSGGWLMPVELEASIIANREQYGIARRICRVVPMSTGSTQIPRVTSDITAYFVAEGNSGTASDPAGDQVTLTLKDLMAYSKIGKSTMMDSVISLAEFVAEEQTRAFSVKEDACLIVGDGTSTYGGIRGINTLLETAAYAGGRATAASNHDTFAEIDNADMSSVIGLLPVYARQGARWVCSGVFEGNVMGRLKLIAGGNNTTTLRDGVVESDYAGFPVSVAHNMPAGVSTDYTDKVMCLLGNFRLGVAFGSGSGIMLTVDPYTLADQNLSRLISVERIDIVNHGVRDSTTLPGPIVCLYGGT